MIETKEYFTVDHLVNIQQEIDAYFLSLTDEPVKTKFDEVFNMDIQREVKIIQDGKQGKLLYQNQEYDFFADDSLTAAEQIDYADYDKADLPRIILNHIKPLKSRLSSAINHNAGKKLITYCRVNEFTKVNSNCISTSVIDPMSGLRVALFIKDDGISIYITTMVEYFFIP